MAIEEVRQDKISRNAPCPCGSGKKYKMCCGAKVVAAERETEERRNPNWTPEGVTALRDDTPGTWFGGRPKWVMKLVLETGGTAEGDADHVINGLLRPYHDRFCAKDMMSFEADDRFQVAVVQILTRRKDEPLYVCPSIFLARYCEVWDVFKERLVEFFCNFGNSDYECEVRWDSSQGGPILTLVDEDGVQEQFFVARPRRLGEDD